MKIVFKNHFFFLLFFVPHLHTPTSTYILLQHRTFYISIMLSTPVIVGVIVLMMIVVSGDDTQALRDTISSLCSLNKVGQFSSCCGSYDNGATITLKDTPAKSCFISGLGSTTGSVLSSLFVICFIFVLFLFISHFQGFSIKRNFCFRERCFLQSHKSQLPLLSSHYLLYSFLPSLLSIILGFAIQQSCFN